MTDIYIYDIYVSWRNPWSWIRALCRMLRRGVRPVIFAWWRLRKFRKKSTRRGAG
jgi:hypothetical protein